MTLSTRALAACTERVAALDGAELARLGDSELIALQSAVGDLRSAVDLVVAQVAGECRARDARSARLSMIARRQGFKSHHEQMAKALGVSYGEAGKFLEVGGLLAASAEEAGAARAALLDGSLTVDKAAVVAATVAGAVKDGSSSDEARELEARLVDKAADVEAWDLRKIGARERERLTQASNDARDRRRREARCLKVSDAPDGMVALNGLLDPLSAAPIKAWMEAQVRSAFAARRQDGSDARSAAQIRVDALAMLASHGLDCDSPGSGVKTTVVVRVDKDALEAGVGLASCDSLTDPISVSQLRSMAADAQVLPVVLGGESAVLDWGRARRLFSPEQVLALVERDGGCSWCHASPSFCQAHHIEWWKRDEGKTDLDNGLLLCATCHHRIHATGVAIEVVGGVVTFILPDGTRRLGGKAHLALGPRGPSG